MSKKEKKIKSGFSCMYAFSKNDNCTYDFLGRPACGDCDKKNRCLTCLNKRTQLCNTCGYRNDMEMKAKR